MCQYTYTHGSIQTHAPNKRNERGKALAAFGFMHFGVQVSSTICTCLCMHIYIYVCVCVCVCVMDTLNTCEYVGGNSCGMG